MKRRKINKLLKKMFGKRFNIWDIMLILIVTPYLYVVYMGLEFDKGILAIYMVLARAITYATIIKWLVTFIYKRAKK